MITKVNDYVLDLLVRFQSDDEGIALTEYLLLLGLLTAAVILAVIAFGDELGRLWGTWVTFMESVPDAPIIPST